MATHSRIFAWKIPWAEEPSGLQSMGSQRVGHDWNDWARTNTMKIWSWWCDKTIYNENNTQIVHSSWQHWLISPTKGLAEKKQACLFPVLILFPWVSVILHIMYGMNLKIMKYTE